MKIEGQKEEVCIIGLGYVGLTLASQMAISGLNVFGAEINDVILKSLKKNKAHFSEKGLNRVIKRSIESKKFHFSRRIPKNNSFSTYIITVGTPLDSEGIPRVDMIKNAVQEVSEVMNNDSLVILRSTVLIGSTREIVKPILEQSGKRYELAMCPERTLEGNAIEELSFLPQIIGSDKMETASRCANLFRTITPKTTIVKNWETAEIIKLVDNTSRDISFAFGNEVSKICNLFEVDAYEVIERGKADYPRTNVALPGPVGGPCLEKDPHILSYSLRNLESIPLISQAARKTNEDQIPEVAKKIAKRLDALGKKDISKKILICGLAFKGIPETDDLRGSMGIKFFNEMKKRQYDISLFDPVIPSRRLKELGKEFQPKKDQIKFDAIIIMNNHPYFENFGIDNFERILRTKNSFIFDFWRSLKDANQSCKYYHLGNLYNL